MIVNHILSPEQIASENPNEVLISGELWKYQYGFSTSFSKKYFVLTKTGFQYYRNKWSANCASDFPLARIDIENVASVKRVKVKFPDQNELYNRNSSTMSKPLNNFSQYQFEIVARTPVQTYDASSYLSPFSKRCLTNPSRSHLEETISLSAVINWCELTRLIEPFNQADVQIQSKTKSHSNPRLDWIHAKNVVL